MQFTAVSINLKTKALLGYFRSVFPFSRFLFMAPKATDIFSLLSSAAQVLFPNHYNRFQMVLENYIDSEHQKKSVIL